MGIFGTVGIVVTYWFFLMKKQKIVQVENETEIIVDGGYNPEVISIPKDKTTKLYFKRIDPTECLEELVMPEFKIKRELPLNQKVMVELAPKRAGEFEYSCGMNMYHGKVKVV